MEIGVFDRLVNTFVKKGLLCALRFDREYVSGAVALRQDSPTEFNMFAFRTIAWSKKIQIAVLTAATFMALC
jgi:hypothetical protein